MTNQPCVEHDNQDLSRDEREMELTIALLMALDAQAASLKTGTAQEILSRFRDALVAEIAVLRERSCRGCQALADALDRELVALNADLQSLGQTGGHS